ncbi:MAG: patatin-like phospholipase family protein [Pseudomonadota bacterium]
MTKTDDGKSISLVLGSGGARGLAHIGVIHWLEENGFRIKSISGCSMGALIGGIYAAGKLPEFEEWVRAITRIDIVNLLDLSWKKDGLIKGDRIINTLKELVGDVAIEELPIAYTAVAADIANEKEVWINSGKLFDAIRASISLPLFFTPFRYKGIDLIDGGVLNPVPIAPTFNDVTDLTIAVNLVGHVDTRRKNPVKSREESEERSPLMEKIGEFIERFRDAPENPVTRDWDAYDIANQAFDAMQSTIARQKLAAYPADCSIEIARNEGKLMEFHRASEMIELGYTKARESLRDIVS